jgi:serine/threonine protein kinase
MGTVYKALGKADRKDYALKVLPARGPWNIRQARRRLASFPTEPHPSVIPFLDVGTSAGLHYLVWPYVAGETLDALVKRDGILPPARAALIGLHIAQALEFCEQHHVYHGLVKPSNVLIEPDGQTKLLDFGVGPLLAEAESSDSLVDTLSESNTALNMLDCLSPEAIIDPARRSVRGDQYSLGCTLYFALTGRYPFPEGSAFEKMAAHQSAQPAPILSLNADVPVPLVVVIERLMQKSAELRYNNLDELIDALHILAREASVYAPPTAAAPAYVAPRGPTTTPLRSTATTLLSGMTPRQVAPGPSSIEMTPAPRPRIPASSYESNLSIPIAEPLAIPTPPPSESMWEQLGRVLMFWKPKEDAVACTLLAPSSILLGESVGLQAVIHDANRTDQAKALPDWRGSVMLTLPRGATVDLHVTFPAITISKPVQQVKWSGFSTAAVFNMRLPMSWQSGMPVQGTLSVSIKQQPVARLDFTLPVDAPNSALQL